MKYYFSTIVDFPFNKVIERVTEDLKSEGFGILTDIDVKETLKKKLDVDFPRYRILGTCNPPYAYQALLKENKIGIMLPCNVIVQELPSGQVEITAVDPVVSMQAVANPDLEEVAFQIREKLKRVIEGLV
ncbi:MAG: DUF302 domain-containing protein [Candidatus Fermentibacteraceae bacterium]|nr:DUF302 domain-containing protein [Candidatus Fermentibacteraceae bacterium]